MHSTRMCFAVFAIAAGLVRHDSHDNTPGSQSAVVEPATPVTATPDVGQKVCTISYGRTMDVQKWDGLVQEFQYIFHAEYQMSSRSPFSLMEFAQRSKAGAAGPLHLSKAFTAEPRTAPQGKKKRGRRAGGDWCDCKVDNKLAVSFLVNPHLGEECEAFLCYNRYIRAAEKKLDHMGNSLIGKTALSTFTAGFEGEQGLGEDVWSHTCTTDVAVVRSSAEAVEVLAEGARPARSAENSGSVASISARVSIPANTQATITAKIAVLPIGGIVTGTVPPPPPVLMLGRDGNHVFANGEPLPDLDVNEHFAEEDFASSGEDQLKVLESTFTPEPPSRKPAMDQEVPVAANGNTRSSDGDVDELENFANTAFGVQLKPRVESSGLGYAAYYCPAAELYCHVAESVVPPSAKKCVIMVDGKVQSEVPLDQCDHLRQDCDLSTTPRCAISADGVPLAKQACCAGSAVSPSHYDMCRAAFAAHGEPETWRYERDHSLGACMTPDSESFWAPLGEQGPLAPMPKLTSSLPQSATLPDFDTELDEGSNPDNWDLAGGMRLGGDDRPMTGLPATMEDFVENELGLDSPVTEDDEDADAVDLTLATRNVITDRPDRGLDFKRLWGLREATNLLTGVTLPNGQLEEHPGGGACPCNSCHAYETKFTVPFRTFGTHGSPFDNHFKCYMENDDQYVQLQEQGYKCTKPTATRNGHVFARTKANEQQSRKAHCWFGRVPMMCPEGCSSCTLKYGPMKKLGKWGNGGTFTPSGYKFKCVGSPSHAVVATKEYTCERYDRKSRECTSLALYHANPTEFECPDKCKRCRLRSDESALPEGLQSEMEHLYMVAGRPTKLVCDLKDTEDVALTLANTALEEFGKSLQLRSDPDGDSLIPQGKAWTYTSGRAIELDPTDRELDSVRVQEGEYNPPERTYAFVACERTKGSEPRTLVPGSVECWVLDHNIESDA